MTDGVSAATCAGDLRRYLGRFLAASRTACLASVLLALLRLPLALVLPPLLAGTLRRALEAPAQGLPLAALLAALSLVSGWIGSAIRLLALPAARRAAAGLRDELLGHIQRVSRRALDGIESSALHARMTRDVDRIEAATGALVAEVLPALLAFVGLAAALLLLSPWLFVLGAGFGALVAALARRFAQGVHSRSLVVQAASDAYHRRVLLTLRTLDATRALATEESERGAHRSKLRDLDGAVEERLRHTARASALQTAVVAGAGLAALVALTSFASAGPLAAAEASSALFVLWLMRGHLESVLGALPRLLEGVLGLRRVHQLLDSTEPEPYTGRAPHELRGRLELRRLRFRYDQRPLLDGLDLAVEPGDSVGILGANGSGKSTLAALILGFYRPEAGGLFADARAYEEFDIRRLRRQIGYLPQDPHLVPGSVFENVLCGRDGLDRRDAERALELAGAGAESYPLALDTIVGEGGIRVSGGQRQRIALARAFVARPRLLLLDEPTNHFDARGAAALAETLARMATTVIVISHDAGVLRRLQRVYRLENGRLMPLAGREGIERVPVRVGA
jgi:ABC-type multidrug transport system fused ATPase/permease subunit